MISKQSLTGYDYLNENRTNFDNLYNVLVKGFEGHDSSFYYICTQPQLKYLFEKFKNFKHGIYLTTFERSGKIKIYNKREIHPWQPRFKMFYRTIMPFYR